MPEHQDVRSDGTVAFLPHRLNRHPVVVRGLTADELWVCAGLSGAAGLTVGIPMAIAFSMMAIAPTARHRARHRRWHFRWRRHAEAPETRPA
ncbi:DUF3487 family protein [Serratia ficaria]